MRTLSQPAIVMNGNGTTYTESGTYTFESTNEFGCAHVTTLNITINNNFLHLKIFTSCDFHFWNGTIYTEWYIYI